MYVESALKMQMCIESIESRARNLRGVQYSQGSHREDANKSAFLALHLNVSLLVMGNEHLAVMRCALITRKVRYRGNAGDKSPRKANKLHARASVITRASLTCGKRLSRFLPKFS